MSLTYIVDGYNALNRSGFFEGRPLKVLREAFLNYLSHHRPQGSPKNRLIVVFDGSRDIFGDRHDRDFEVMFTKGESADDMIRRLVDESVAPATVVVVTDDRELAAGARVRGARVMATGDFLKKKRRLLPGTPSSMEGAGGASSLNIVERDAITRELKELWLGKREDRKKSS